VIQIAISHAAFDAIASTLPPPLGSVGFENATNERGERLVWLEPKVINHLRPCAAPARATAMSSSCWPPPTARRTRRRPWTAFRRSGHHTPIARTLKLGSAGFENKTNEQGEKLIWLDRAMVDGLRSLRGAGESYSDVILRLASESV
jgi:hypothetical protein